MFVIKASTPVIKRVALTLVSSEPAQSEFAEHHTRSAMLSILTLMPLAALLSSAVQPIPPAAVGTGRCWGRAHAPVMCAPGDEQWTEADDMGLSELLARARVSHLSAPDLALVAPDEVYVLIFNMENEDKGIYALRGRAMRARSHVLAFEESVDASQFAELLEVRCPRLFPSPPPLPPPPRHALGGYLFTCLEPFLRSQRAGHDLLCARCNEQVRMNARTRCLAGRRIPWCHAAAVEQGAAGELLRGERIRSVAREAGCVDLAANEQRVRQLGGLLVVRRTRVRIAWAVLGQRWEHEHPRTQHASATSSCSGRASVTSALG